MKNRATSWTLLFVLLAVGCTSHPKRIECEKHLTPINAPAPATPAEPHP